jgi:hypothetical protein
VMDEPFSGLDVLQQENVHQLLQEVSLTNEENTLIIVTHDVSAAVAVCDTIWLMGRDRDPQGNVIPGARIVEEIDLIERDLCWHPDIRQRPEYIQLVNEIKERFHTLGPPGDMPDRERSPCDAEAALACLPRHRGISRGARSRGRAGREMERTSRILLRQSRDMGMEMKRNEMWSAVAEATRPLQPPDNDKRDALGRVVRAIEDAREAGIDSREMAEVRGLALVALSEGDRRKLVSAMAKIHGTALVERAKTRV